MYALLSSGVGSGIGALAGVGGITGAGAVTVFEGILSVGLSFDGSWVMDEEVPGSAPVPVTVGSTFTAVTF